MTSARRLVPLGIGVLFFAACLLLILYPTPAALGGGSYGGTLNQPLPVEPTTLSNLMRVDNRGRILCEQYLTPTLLFFDPDTLEPTPALAASLPEVSPDRLSYTWTLRPDAKWEDGTPVTTKDVKLAYDLGKDEATGATKARALFRDVKAIEILDEHRFRVVYDKVNYRAMLDLGIGFPMVPAHALAGVAPKDVASHPTNRRPLAYGPYKLESWTTGSEIVLVRNPSYWGAKPFLDGQRFRISKDGSANPRLLRQNQIDWAVLSADDWKATRTDPDFDKRVQRFTYYLPQEYLIGWNCKSPLFVDAHVRLALSHAIRRQEIIDRVLDGHAQPCVSPWGVMDPAYASDLKPPAFDLETSRKLLVASGWTDTDGDGILDKDGRKFEFDLQQGPDQEPLFSALLTTFKSDLEKLGIVCNLRPMEWKVFLANLDERHFDAYFALWNEQPVDEDPSRLLHSAFAKRGDNYAGYESPEMDRLLDQARGEFDRAARIKLYHRVQEILNEEQPLSFLFAPEVLLAVNRNFGGVKAHKLGIRTVEWWIITH